LIWGVLVSVLGDDVATSHPSGRMTGRIEVVTRVSGRRYWTVEQKLGMLRDTFGPGGSVRAAIERHEISSGLLYTWRKQAMSGELIGITPAAVLPDFAEVRIAAPEQQVALLPPVPAPDVSGRMSIELLSGIRISVNAQVDAAALARVLAVLPS
jgi:transposase